MRATNITEEHPSAFEALTSGDYDNFALFSCLLNGQRASAIVAVTAHRPDDKDGETKFHIKPLPTSPRRVSTASPPTKSIPTFRPRMTGPEST